MSGGPLPCHLDFDKEENLLLVSNYGGNFSAFKVSQTDGKIEGQIYSEDYESLGSNAVPDR